MLLKFFRIDKLNDDDYWDSEEFLGEVESDIIPQIGSYVMINKNEFHRKVVFISHYYHEENIGNNYCDICLLTNSYFEKYMNDEYNLDVEEEY